MSYQSARLSSCRQLPFTRGARVAATNAVSTTSSTAAQLTSEFTSKQRSAVEIIKHHIGLIRDKDASLGSFLHVDEEGAMSQAQALDARLAAGEQLGPLAGVPVAVKDNICTQGVPSTAGSRYLENYTPPYDATAVARLRAAGAIIIGKTNCDEFGMGSTTENSAYRNTKNAWSAEHVPGGSSGGSAAAVAAGLVPVALGSDTGGSVRQPAHFNGCVGLKPTYGRVSRYGLLAYASSLDCIGGMSRTVEDVATTLEVMAGHDPQDATSLHAPVETVAARFPSASELPSKPLDGLKVGVIEECMGPGLSDSVRATAEATCKHLESLGASIGNVQLPNFSAGLPAYYIIATSEASSNLSRYDGVRYGNRASSASLQDMYCMSRGQGMGEEVKRRILMGTYALSAGYYDAFYKKAQQVRTIVSRDFEAALKEYDVLLSPVATHPAYKFGEKTDDPLSMYLGDLMTVNLNMAGLPAVALNCGFHKEGELQLPIGMQFIGKHLQEPQLLGVAHAVELTHEPAQTFPQ